MWQKTIIAGLLLGLSPLAGADGVNGSAVLGAGLGAAAGAAVGSAVGGKDGAIVGGAIGGAAGAAVGSNNRTPRTEAPREVAVPEGERGYEHDRGRKLGHYKHWHGRGWRHEHHGDD